MTGDKFYGQLTLRTVSSREQATADLERAVETLSYHCPEVLSCQVPNSGARVACAGITKLKDRG